MILLSCGGTDEAVSISMSRFMEELESALGTSEAAVAKEDGLDDSDSGTESGTCYFPPFKDGNKNV